MAMLRRASLTSLRLFSTATPAAVPSAVARGGSLLPAATRGAAGTFSPAVAPIKPKQVTSTVAPMKKYKPTSPGMRHRLIVDKKDLWKGGPEPSLTERLKMHAGRNSSGSITVRGREAPLHRRKYRMIDFFRRRPDPAYVERFEYDPNRSAFIALIKYPSDGTLSYILAPDGLEEGARVQSGEEATLELGHAMPLHVIPDGFAVHNIELFPGKGGRMCRAAGTSATIMSKEERYVQLKMQSGEVRKVMRDAYATIGAVSNSNHKLRVLGKAGASRWIGRRPKVRGVAMNPVDHPMGGGEGKTSGGRPSCSPWGWYTKGLRTRNRKQFSSKLIVKRRNHEKLNLSVKNTGGW